MLPLIVQLNPWLHFWFCVFNFTNIHFIYFISFFHLINLNYGRYVTVMTPDFKCRETWSCPPEAIWSDQEINQRTTAIRTFESDDQTPYRILMSRNYALVSLIKAQSMHNDPFDATRFGGEQVSGLSRARLHGLHDGHLTQMMQKRFACITILEEYRHCISSWGQLRRHSRCKQNLSRYS